MSPCVSCAGPEHWADTYSACAGGSQSPIDIEPGKATYKDIGSLTLSGYDTAAGHVFQLTNNGHTGTVYISIASSIASTVTEA